MNFDSYEETRIARQRYGNKKYGNKDVDRDKIEDAIEEIADVENILLNRLPYQLIEKFGYIGTDVFEQLGKIHIKAHELLNEVNKLDSELRSEYDTEYIKLIEAEEVDRI